MKITEPLRLAVGSHQAGSGQGCAMNVISWESGDTEITDLPACADRMLARIVQSVNDTWCNHTVTRLLCPECSLEVLALAHRTVGTGTLPLSDLERRRVWVRVAVALVRAVSPAFASPHLRKTALDAVDVADAWAHDPDGMDVESFLQTARLASGFAGLDVAQIAVASSALDADYHATEVWEWVRGYCAPDVRIHLAHRAIDTFEQWTGARAVPTPAAVTSRAYERMTAVTV